MSKCERDVNAEKWWKKSDVDRSEYKKNMMKIEKPFRLANEELENEAAHLHF